MQILARFVHIKAYLLFVNLLSLSLLPLQANAAVPDNVQAVFAGNTCLTCHAGATPFGGLSLDDAAIADTSLVDIAANCSLNNAKLVDPGNPQASVLYLKLASQTPNCGGVMPPSGNLISAADLNTIFNWIVSIGPAAQFGLFSMAQTAVNVNETDTQVVITVNRELGAGGAVTVDFSVETVGADTAVSPTDYQAQTGTLTFADGETSKDITIILADDDVFEDTEVFSVTLSNPLGGAVIGEASQTKISIIDNEFDVQPGTFFFSRVSYVVAENAGSFDVMILRSFGAAGQVSVNLASTDGSAIVNSDYQIVNSDLIFEEGVKNQIVTVLVLDDAIEEPNENFRLALSNPGNGAILGAVNNVNVRINDDDAPVGGGDGGGDGSGGGDGGDASTDDDTTVIEPVQEVDFEAAGSMGLFGGIFLLLFLRRREALGIG